MIKEPREWTIVYDIEIKAWEVAGYKQGYPKAGHGYHSETIHVIDKSAYDEQAKKIAELESFRDRIFRERRK